MPSYAQACEKDGKGKHIGEVNQDKGYTATLKYKHWRKLERENREFNARERKTTRLKMRLTKQEVLVDEWFET